MSKVSRDNIGRFEVTRELLAESDMDVLMEVFKEIFVLKIVEKEYVPNQTILYVGVSSMFRKVEQGSVIPLYKLEIEQIQLKTKIRYKVTAIEIEEDQNDNWMYM